MKISDLFVYHLEYAVRVKSSNQIYQIPQINTAIILDFVENYSWLIDEEVQSAHWTIQQVTLHPWEFACRQSQTCGNYYSHLANSDLFVYHFESAVRVKSSNQKYWIASRG